MPRRVNLPRADDLFRPTVVPDRDTVDADDLAVTETELVELVEVIERVPEETDAEGVRPRTSGRVRHDEKMTVYLSSDELLDLEDARLALRRRHGMAVDRGRLVRAAVALALTDLDENGEDSALVTLLRTT